MDGTGVSRVIAGGRSRGGGGGYFGLDAPAVGRYGGKREIATDAGADAGSHGRVDGVDGRSRGSRGFAEAVQARRLRRHRRRRRGGTHVGTAASGATSGRRREVMAVGALVEKTDVASLRMLLPHRTREHRGGGGRKRNRRERRHLLTSRGKLHEIGLHRLTEDFVVEIDDGLAFSLLSQHFFVDVLMMRKQPRVSDRSDTNFVYVNLFYRSFKLESFSTSTSCSY